MEKNWVLYYVEKNRFQLILVVLSLFTVTILNVMVADNLRNITDSIIVKKWDQIKHYLILLGLVILCGFIFQFFNQYLIGKWASRCLVDLREKFSNVLLNVTIEKLNSTKGGDIISVFTNDLRTVYVFLKVHLVKFISQVFMVIFSFIYLFFINKLVTLAIIVIVPVVILVTNHFTKSFKEYSKECGRSKCSFTGFF